MMRKTVKCTARFCEYGRAAEIVTKKGGIPARKPPFLFSFVCVMQQACHALFLWHHTFLPKRISLVFLHDDTYLSVLTDKFRIRTNGITALYNAVFNMRIVTDMNII